MILRLFKQIVSLTNGQHSHLPTSSEVEILYIDRPQKSMDGFYSLIGKSVSQRLECKTTTYTVSDSDIFPTLASTTTASTDNSALNSSVITKNTPDISIPEDIQENNVFGPITDFMESYQEFLSQLSPEQLACLSNLFGYILIFFCIGSITSIYFGEQLIQYLKLEIRFPKLAKIIQLRQRFKTYYFIMNIFIIYCILFFFIGINIYMFLTV